MSYFVSGCHCSFRPMYRITESRRIVPLLCARLIHTNSGHTRNMHMKCVWLVRCTELDREPNIAPSTILYVRRRASSTAPLPHFTKFHYYYHYVVCYSGSFCYLCDWVARCRCYSLFYFWSSLARTHHCERYLISFLLRRSLNLLMAELWCQRHVATFPLRGIWFACFFFFFILYSSFVCFFCRSTVHHNNFFSTSTGKNNSFFVRCLSCLWMCFSHYICFGLTIINTVQTWKNI